MAAVTGWLATRELFAAPVFSRRNYRGASVPVGVGILLVIGRDRRRGAPRGGRSAQPRSLRRPTGAGGRAPGGRRLLAARPGRRPGRLGRRPGGFTGPRGSWPGPALHRCPQAGRRPGSWRSWPPLLQRHPHRSSCSGTRRIALAANLANLFDRAPGRTTKVGAVRLRAAIWVRGNVGELIAPGSAVVIGGPSACSARAR